MTLPPIPDQRQIPSLGLTVHEPRDKPPVMVIDKDIGQRRTQPIHDRQPMPIIAAALPNTGL